MVKYFPETQSLWIDSGKSLGEGETIAKGVVVFYGNDDDTTAEGVRIELAEHVLKPFVDAIVAKYASKPGTMWIGFETCCHRYRGRSIFPPNT